MMYLKKHWYLIVAAVVTVGLAIVVFLTSGRLSQTKQVAPTVPQQEPQAVSAACSITFTASCINIVAYKDGIALSASDLSALQPGDIITLALAAGNSAIKVRFRVNSSSDADWHETTIKNGNGEFIWDYTLENTTNFVIHAQYFDGSVWN